MGRSGQQKHGSAVSPTRGSRIVPLPAGVSEETLRWAWQSAYDILQYEAGYLDEDGHQWCVKAAASVVEDLEGFGIEAQFRQCENWLDLSGGAGTARPRDGEVGFCHPLANDPSHCWVELADGTIIDTTISQFPVDDFPYVDGFTEVAVVPPGHPYASHYRLS